MLKLIKAVQEASSPQMASAIRRGYEDAANGIHECPYGDHRTGSGRVSWSRAFIRAWKDGQEIYRKEHE